MEIKAGLHIKRNKRSFYLSFFTLSFVLVFPLFFDFNEQQALNGQVQNNHLNSNRDLLSKKAKSGISISAADLK